MFGVIIGANRQSLEVVWESKFFGSFPIFLLTVYVRFISLISFFYANFLIKTIFFYRLIRIKMQTQNKRNSQFMLAKEIFIDHKLAQIQDHYEINQKCLGEGGFGRVFEGRRKQNMHPNICKQQLGESFSSYDTSSRCCSEEPAIWQGRAIKRISYTQTSDKELMRNEMEILSYLDHPLIVKIYETLEHKKQLYLVIDLLKGGDLFTVVSQREKLTEAEAKVVFIQLVRALKYLHSQHICHRDLKLENVMFVNQQDFAIKLVDFGLAFCWEDDMRKELRQKGLHNKMTGTPDYMSPEMIAKNYDQRCDIWSAGVILYILLAGQAPFQATTQKLITEKINNLDYTFDIPEFTAVTQSAKDLIQQILKPQNQRISLDQILQHPWIQEDNSKETLQIEIPSTKSVTSERKLRKKLTEFKLNNIVTKKTERNLRKSSQNMSEDFDTESCKSYCSEDVNHESNPEQLTVGKLQHYSRMSMLQKFQALFSVSRLSDTQTGAYGQEFLLMDKDNDGTVSPKDFAKYLEENQGYTEQEQIQTYFGEVALSKRGYISYSEYLACVLAYHGDYFGLNHAHVLDYDERCSENAKSSDFSQQDSINQAVDLFDDCLLEELFALLDRNCDGEISKQDFIYLLTNNGIEEQNADFIEEITARLKEMNNYEDTQSVKKQSKGPWFIDHRTYKDQLSRTYKGESDGGIRVGWRGFQQLMRGFQTSRN